MTKFRLISLQSPDDGFSAEVLGGKGFNLWKMAQAGINVPPAYIIPTDVCRAYYDDPAKVMNWLEEAVNKIRKGMEQHYGYEPMVSVRSGAKVSMPGMMETILNVGIDEETREHFTTLGDKCLIDCEARFRVMYGNAVFGHVLEGELPHRQRQIILSIEAVFRSWNTPRAINYRNLKGIAHDLGTAVVVQAMVFGNLNEQSATGVMFSRDPATGDNKLVGEFLVEAQGEDVVDGTKTPRPLKEIDQWNSEMGEKLVQVATRLEIMNKDVQDIEFTVQDGELFILQTRNAARTGQAAVKIAVDLVKEGLIDAETAVGRVTFDDVRQASRVGIDPEWLKANPPHANGLDASPGVAVGKAVFTAEAAVNADCAVILLRPETLPDDIAGMAVSVGVLTQKGGKTSHAAVNARSLNKPAVVGCAALQLHDKKGWILHGSDNVVRMIEEGDWIAIDGSTGAVWVGPKPVLIGGISGAAHDFLHLLSEVYGYYEVATKAADIINDKRVVFPAYAVTSVAEFEAEVAKMAAVVDDLIIDLRSVPYDKASFALVRLWDEEWEVEQDLIDKTMALISLKLVNVRVICPGLISASKLEGAGYKVVPVVLTPVDMAEAKGLVVADHAALAKNLSETTKALESNPKLASLNCATEIDGEALARGVKFAITPLLAARSLLI